MDTSHTTEKQWKQHDMNKAYDACTSGRLSVYAASKMYGVPRTTLNDRVLGKVPLVACKGPGTALTNEEETSLKHYISYMADHGFPLTRDAIIHYAWAIDSRRPENQQYFGANGPSLMWWRGFRKRHGDLSLRLTESVSKQIVTNINKETMDQYFDLLEETIRSNGLQHHPELIYNCDESAILLHKYGSRVLVPRRNRRAHAVCTANSAHVSVLCAASASGNSLPLMIIFKNGLPTGRFNQDGPINVAYSSSDSGFVNRNIYQEWFSKVFSETRAKAKTPSLTPRWSQCVHGAWLDWHGGGK